MKKTVIMSAIMLIGSGMFTGCKKYEEGPALSLKSKKARVANEWKIQYAFDLEDGEVVTSDFSGETWEFSKNGEWIERENGVIDKSGIWEFVSDKETIRITKPNGIDHYNILKLKEKEIWLQDKDEELHLIPVN